VVVGEGDEVVAVAVTMGGEFRGAPYVAEEVSAFLSGSRPTEVSVGDHTAFRVGIGDEEWLMYNNEAYLFITIGPRSASRRVMRDLAQTSVPYLWQPGDCLDFADEYDSATPYAPFGEHGLRHCGVTHTHEVIHSEVLPEGPDARFPADLSDRSRITCARAFRDFTGRSELETTLLMTRYLPDRDEWAKGSRYLACIVGVAGPDGEVAVEGRIDGRDPALVFTLEVGTCLFGLFPVECDQRHDSEIIAAFDLPDGPDAPLPDVDDLRERLGDRCDEELAAFALGEGPGEIEVFELTDVFGSWELGLRRVYCRAAAFGDDGFRLDITGTFGSGWEEAEEQVAT
jgi:hypothetical protein